MLGVYINCKGTPFIDLILAGRKTYETRTRDVLRSLIGQRVALIQTGTGRPTVRAYATITRSVTVASSDAAMRQAACIMGTAYDIAPDGKKVFYQLENVKPVEPFQPVISGKNHGRSFCEISA